LYDQDSLRYDSGRMEISHQAFTNPEELALDITATKGGFVEVYVYNGSALPVWYDQFSISSSQAVILQENHYYLFGMQIAGLELDLNSQNRYLYNGKELQDDHNLDWHDYGARKYDAQIGRWNVVDPMADIYQALSPYNYTSNNPIKFIDPNGMWFTASDILISSRMAEPDDIEEFRTSGSDEIEKFISSGQKNSEGDCCPGDKNKPDLNGGDMNGAGVLKNVTDGANYASGAIGLTQIGMLEYRIALSLSSKTETFSSFSSTYRGLGVASKTLGRAGTYIGAHLSVGLDYSAYRSG